jgi:hypothetical protein
MIRTTSDNKGIVWLASYPKSGNTWLRVFLYHLIRIQNGAPREEDEINKLDRVSLYEGRLAAMFSHYLGRPVAAASVAEVAKARPVVHRAIAERLDRPTFVKTHCAFMSVFGTPQVNPSVTVGTVYMVRDPRDVAISLAHHLGVLIDEAIKVMQTPGFGTRNSTEGPFEMWGTWSEHVASWTRQDDPTRLVVRYEDLVADPAGKFAEVVTHLRQDVSPEVVAEAVEASTFETLAGAEKVHRFKETSERADRFFRQGKAGAWREQLSEEQSKRIVDAHWTEMERNGYGLN